MTNNNNKEKVLEEQFEELYNIVKKRCKGLIPNLSAKGYCINELITLTKDSKEREALKEALDIKFYNIESSKYCTSCFQTKNDLIMTNKFTKYAIINKFDIVDKSLSLDSIKPVCDKCFKLLDFKYIFSKISQLQNQDSLNEEDECVSLIRHFAMLNKIDILQSDWKDKVQEIYSILFALYTIINNLPSISVKVGKDSKDLIKYNSTIEILKQL
ncbi:hypothetical protein RB653_007269 [Dictyostelium firmibasis]|uniref:Uncharacterized protein n=1 Tax=Dictyostelium firmibasis TaxID=79012 RepID=A0AAN7TVC6_9MYCE